MSNVDLKKRIVEELGIDEENVSSYETDINLISEKIGNYNVIAEGDAAYNKDLNYNVISTVNGEVDTYHIVEMF